MSIIINRRFSGLSSEAVNFLREPNSLLAATARIGSTIASTHQARDRFSRPQVRQSRMTARELLNRATSFAQRPCCFPATTCRSCSTISGTDIPFLPTRSIFSLPCQHSRTHQARDRFSRPQVRQSRMTARELLNRATSFAQRPCCFPATTCRSCSTISGIHIPFLPARLMFSPPCQHSPLQAINQ